MEQVYKQRKNEKKIGSSGIHKTGYHNESYLLLLE